MVVASDRLLFYQMVKKSLPHEVTGGRGRAPRAGYRRTAAGSTGPRSRAGSPRMRERPSRSNVPSTGPSIAWRRPTCGNRRCRPAGCFSGGPSSGGTGNTIFSAWPCCCFRCACFSSVECRRMPCSRSLVYPIRGKDRFKIKLKSSVSEHQPASLYPSGRSGLPSAK